MTNLQPRLLLLSAGSLAAQNVIDALGARRAQCVLIGTNSLAEAAGNFRCDIAYLTPPAASGDAYISRIAELIRDEQPDMVIPCRDDDILALAQLGERVPSGNAVLLTGSVAAARIVNDKAHTARFAKRHGLPFAPTAENSQEALDLATVHRLPLIGKPRSGFASKGVVLLRSAAEIERAFALNPDLIAQPFLDPPANMDALTGPFESGMPFFYSFPQSAQHSVQFIVGPNGEMSNPAGCLVMQSGGQAILNRRCDDPELLDAGRAYGTAAAAEGWKGPLNVQLRRDRNGRLAAFEINGRFSGGTAARALLGYDEIGEAMRLFLAGMEFPSIPRSHCDIVQRYLHSHPIPNAAVIELQTAGRWSAIKDV